MMENKPIWHTKDVNECIDYLKTDIESGLSEAEARQRLERYGKNELIDYGIKPWWKILFDQFRETMVIVLLIAGAISYIIGDWKDTVAILAIVILNAILGFVQEYRAEQAIAALKRMAAPSVKVKRDGTIKKIDSHQLVPGDVIYLEAGDAVPADARLIEVVNLRVQEASLTGESVPVEKDKATIDEADTPLGDRKNMIYMGTAVTYGRGSAVIVQTGMNTELGHIATMLQSVESEATPLQKRIAQLGKNLAWIALGIVALVFVLGLLRGENPIDMLLTAVAMAVAAVPEGLPAVVTITLALGAQRMLKRRALIRKLPAVETLGSVTTICSDKTGTLTENRMTVTVLDIYDHTLSIDALLDRGKPYIEADTAPNAEPMERSLVLLLKAAALCNDAVISEPSSEDDKTLHTIGDPTEGAILVAAAQIGLWRSQLDQRWPRVGEVPFTSERKRMSTIHKTNISSSDPTDAPWRDAPYVLFCKGAIDSMLDLSTQVWSGDQWLPMDEEMKQRILTANDRLAKDGQRVLGVGFRPMHELPETIDESLENQLVFIGLLGMIDPPRSEAKEAVELCKTAGIRPVMITGDHPLTALKIARDLGIADENDRVLTGVDLNQLSAEELESIVEDVAVYARVSPANKLNIVEALQNRGHITAMTGDGVNDAPALRRADIGVAMGITGTDVSKEAADMVILDDNFATIVNAVEEGRTIYDNIRKFIKYTMTSNAAELYVMLIAPFLGMPLPLSALQILWINLVTDGLPGLALSVEPPEPDIMKRPPFKPDESIFSRGLGKYILWIGLLMGLLSLGVGYGGWRLGDPYWQTMLFTTLTLSQMANALAVRSDRESLFRIGLLSNKMLLGAVLLTFILQMGAVYWSPAQSFFNTQALPVAELLFSLGSSVLTLIVVEIWKWVVRRRENK